MYRYDICILDKKHVLSMTARSRLYSRAGMAGIDGSDDEGHDDTQEEEATLQEIRVIENSYSKDDVNQVSGVDEYDFGRIQARVKEKLNLGASISLIDSYGGRPATREEFIAKYQEDPSSISEICKEETNETIIHILAKEGRLDILKEVCDETKSSNKEILNTNLLRALKHEDNFDQPPLLAAFNAELVDKTQETTAEYLLDKISEFNDDKLTESTLSKGNKTNDTVLTGLLKHKEIYDSAIKKYFKAFTKYHEKKGAHSCSKGFYELVLQMIEKNGCNSFPLMGQLIFEIKDASKNFLKAENKIFSHRSKEEESKGQNILMRLATNIIDDGLRELLVNTNTYRYFHFLFIFVNIIFAHLDLSHIQFFNREMPKAKPYLQFLKLIGKNECYFYLSHIYYFQNSHDRIYPCHFEKRIWLSSLPYFKNSAMLCKAT